MSEIISHFDFKYTTIEAPIEFKGITKQIQLDVQMLKSVEDTIDELFSAYQVTGDSKPLEDFAPYFGTIWPSARSLTKYLIDNFNESWKGFKILEIGCGLAIPSLCLAKLGCKIVTSDYHPDVKRFLNRNLELNNIHSIEYTSLDWRLYLEEFKNKYGEFDIIIGSDILYDREQPLALISSISKLLKSGGTAYISDPGRPYLQSFFNGVKDSGLSAIEKAIDDNIFLIEIKREA